MPLYIFAMDNNTKECKPTAANLPGLERPIFWVLCAVLAFSLLLHFIWCLSKCFSGIRRLRTRKSRDSRQMEENPIYGNLIYNPTDVNGGTEADPPSSSLSSSSFRNPQGVFSGTQGRSQECYANLSLKAPRQHCGNSSSEIQCSGEVNLEEPPESGKENDDGAYAASPTSDLYASVNTPRTKTIDTAGDGEEYANHL